MLNFVLCDDNLPILKRLSQMLKSVFEKYDYDIMHSGFSAAEWFAIGKLIDPYINCKTGKCARCETLAIQNDIKLRYERSKLNDEQATA